LRPQRRVGVVGPIAPSLARKTVLIEHPDDGNHRKTAVVDLCEQALLLLLLVRDAPAPGQAEGAVTLVVARVLLGGALQIGDLNVADEREDLQPAEPGDLGHGCQAVRDVLETQALRRREEARPLEVVGHDVSDARNHGHAAVLELDDPAALELRRGDRGVIVLGQAQGVPVAQRRAHAELRGEIQRRTLRLRPQRRVGVVGPIAPSLARKTVLIEHPDDGNHRKTAVVDLCEQALLLLLLVRDAPAPGQAEGAVTLVVARVLLGGALQIGDLNVADEREDLQPAEPGDLGHGCQAVRDVLETQALRRREEARPFEVVGHDVSDAR